MIISFDTIFGVDFGFEIYPEDPSDPDVSWSFLVNLFIVRFAVTKVKK